MQGEQAAVPLQLPGTEIGHIAIEREMGSLQLEQTMLNDVGITDGR